MGHVDKGGVPLYRGALCMNVFFISSGDFVYFPNSAAHFHSLEVDAHQMKHGDYLCEAALWCKWRHQGFLEAASSGALHTIPVKSFCDIMVDHAEAHVFCCDFASKFL